MHLCTAILLNLLPNMERHICQSPNCTLPTTNNTYQLSKRLFEAGGVSGLQWFISSQESYSLKNISWDIIKQISPQNILCGKSLCCTGLPNTLSTAVIWSTATAASRSHSPFLRRSFPKYFTGHWKSMLCILFPHRDMFLFSIKIEKFTLTYFWTSLTNTLMYSNSTLTLDRTGRGIYA